jgi:hypothetical protein
MDKNRPAAGTVPFDTAQIRGFLDERFINGGPLFDQWLAEHERATLLSRNLVAGEYVAPMVARARRESAAAALLQVASLPIDPEDFRGSFTMDADLIEAGADLPRRAIRDHAASLYGVKTLKR